MNPSDPEMDEALERLIGYIGEIVELRRDMIKDLEEDRDQMTKDEIEERESSIGAIGLAIEGMDELKCQIRGRLAKKH